MPVATGSAVDKATARAIVPAAIATVAASHTTEIFGVMGNGNAHFIDAIIDEGLGYNALRHEAGAVVAADAYARATGQVGVATTTFGAGFTNTLTALADAVRARSSVVIITGDSPTTGPRSSDVDIPALVRGVGATTWAVKPGNETAVTELAFQSAIRNGRPAVLSIPFDLAPAEIAASTITAHSSPEIDLRPNTEPTRRKLSPEITATLLGAERLLLISGRGAVSSRSGQLARQLAESHSAMTATSILANGLMGDYRRHLGIAGGFGSDAAAKVMASADVVLVLGAGLNGHSTRKGAIFGHRATVIQVDASRLPTSSRVNHYVRMDVAEFLTRAVADRLETGVVRKPGWSDHPLDVADLRPLETVASAGIGLNPQALAAQIAKHLPAQRSLVVDGGNFMAWPISSWPVDAPEAFMPAGIAYQSIGLALPAMVGMAAANPHRVPVVAVGDGGLLMSIADLESVARLVRRGLIVVFNDSAYGAELHQYGPFGFDTTPMRFPTVDFAAVARSFGLSSAVVTQVDDLGPLKKWVDDGSEGVMLLDCRIADDVTAPFLAR